MWRHRSRDHLIAFLADRTNGRAYATVLRLSVVCRRRRRRLWRYVLWLNGAS